MRAMIDEDLVRAHRERAMTPDRPVFRGTSQNPDVFFQGRETVNPFYDEGRDLVQAAMDRFAELTGRSVPPVRLRRRPEDAERVIVLMGSGIARPRSRSSTWSRSGEKVGMIKVRLFRPFALALLFAALPRTAKSMAVLDRTKEPGATASRCTRTCVTALARRWPPAPWATRCRVVGGRYGLSSKEFTPAMVKACSTSSPRTSRRTLHRRHHDDVSGS
jgi:pyruvate-ferredoxin/flavodoxin oxidoreductase